MNEKDAISFLTALQDNLPEGEKEPWVAVTLRADYVVTGCLGQPMYHIFAPKDVEFWNQIREKPGFKDLRKPCRCTDVYDRQNLFMVEGTASSDGAEYECEICGLRHYISRL